MLLPDIAEYLEGQGLGLTRGTNLYVVPFPASSPDAAVCLVEYPGEAAERAMGPSLDPPALERPRFQVVVRDGPDNAQAGRDTMESIYQKLDNLGPVTLNGRTYHDVSALQPPIPLPDDDNDRRRWVCSFAVEKERG